MEIDSVLLCTRAKCGPVVDLLSGVGGISKVSVSEFASSSCSLMSPALDPLVLRSVRLIASEAGVLKAIAPLERIDETRQL
jgi:hypothetical protein